jgi:hypothetical protein
MGENRRDQQDVDVAGESHPRGYTHDPDEGEDHAESEHHG